MKPSSKWIIALVTATTIIGPLVPKTVNLNISIPSKDSPSLLPRECKIYYRSLSSDGLVCGYRCMDGSSSRTIQRRYNSAGDCSEYIILQ